MGIKAVAETSYLSNVPQWTTGSVDHNYGVVTISLNGVINMSTRAVTRVGQVEHSPREQYMQGRKIKNYKV
jgi:hypothetical protein